MSNHWSTPGRLGPRPIKKPRRDGPSQLTGNPRRSLIHVLNDDILLNIFYLYRLHIKDEEDGENTRFSWDRQRWWYKLVQVSRKWRYLILAFPQRLDIHLLCTYGVPIADMLAHSPPLPLAIWYTNEHREMTAKDEEGALLALSHRDRVHRIALRMPAPNLCKFIAAMDEEYPILEHICIGSRPRGSTSPTFPGTFQAPNLRHVWTTWRPIGSPLLTTTMGLVNLELMDIPPSPWIPPTYILTRLSLMPHLETLRIHFCTPHPNRDVETSAMTHATLPNLHEFSFRGVSAYLEGFARIRAPRLSILDVQFFNQLTFSVPRLLQFIQASESLSFCAVTLIFHSCWLDLLMMTTPDQTWLQSPLRLRIMGRQLDWQVASAVQIFDTLSPIISGVEELTLSYVIHRRASHGEVDRTQWRKLFTPFSNVKKLGVPDSLSAGLSHSLRSEDGEIPLELLPKLMDLIHLDGNGVHNVFTPFINERHAAGHPVHLVSQGGQQGFKTDEQALAFVEAITKSIDENPQSAEAASKALDEILRTYPPSSDIDDSTVVPSFGFDDLQSISPPSHPFGNDVFGEFFDETPTPELVAGSPQVSHAKAGDTYGLLRPNVCKEISGGNTMAHQTSGWKWEGLMETSDQAWAISTI